MTAHEQALLLIASARAALKNGVLHYDVGGRPLTTEREIFATLQRDGSITFDTSNRVQRTTDLAELEGVCREFVRPAR
jgi:hypothetical protein